MAENWVKQWNSEWGILWPLKNRKRPKTSFPGTDADADVPRRRTGKRAGLWRSGLSWLSGFSFCLVRCHEYACSFAYIDLQYVYMFLCRHICICPAILFFFWRWKSMPEPMRRTWTLTFRDLNFGFGSSFCLKIGCFYSKGPNLWVLKFEALIPHRWGVSHAVATAAYRRPAQCLSGDGYRGLANSSHSTGKAKIHGRGGSNLSFDGENTSFFYLFNL